MIALMFPHFQVQVTIFQNIQALKNHHIGLQKQHLLENILSLLLMLGSFPFSFFSLIDFFS